MTYAKKSTRLLGEDLIKVRVGKGGNCQIHHVHKKLLSQRSAFFDAAISSGFRESHENEIVLEEDNPLIFEFFLTWLYTSQLPSHAYYADVCIRLREDISVVFLRLLSVADKYIAPDLEALCYERIRDLLHDYYCPSFTFVRELYNLTPSASQLRRYIIEAGTYMLLEESVELFMRDMWKELLDDVEPFSHDVSKAVIRSTPLKTDQKPAMVHPYHIVYFKKLREKGAICSSFRSRSGNDCATPPPETDIDDPDGLIKKICDRIATLKWKDKDEDSIRWPHELPSERAMSGAGFYHDPTSESPDKSYCMHCEIELSDWEPDQKPFLRHQTVNPDCPFVQATEMGLRPPILPRFVL